MKPLKIISKITPLISKAGVFVNDKAPEILVIGGVVAVVGAGILAVEQTLDKVPEIIDEHDELAEMINSATCEEMTEEELEKDRVKSLKKNDRHMTLQLVKTYALPAGMTVVGVTAILAGNHLLRARYVASATDCAPLIPSGWLCVTIAEVYASLFTSFNDLPIYAHADTLIADPLAQLPYGFELLSFSHLLNIPPYPLFGYLFPKYLSSFINTSLEFLSLINQFATAMVITVSSVNVEPNSKSSNSFDFIELTSKVDPIISPHIAPFIAFILSFLNIILFNIFHLNLICGYFI